MRDLRHFDKLPPTSELVKETNPMFIITMDGISQASTVQAKIKVLKQSEAFLKTDQKFMIIFVWQGKRRTDGFEILPIQCGPLLLMLTNNGQTNVD